MAKGHKGKGVLLHVLVEGGGLPVSATSTPANANERDLVLPLLDRLRPQTRRPGRPRTRFKVLAADKGYDRDSLRATLRKRGIRPQFPKRRRKGGARRRGRPVLCSAPRYIVERSFAWLQRRFRRLAVRWERRSVFFEAFLQLSLIFTWIRELTKPSDEVVG